MRLLMGIIKDRHGTYYLRRKVPQKLEVEVARLMGSDKTRVSWLKRSLGTKDIKQANVRAKPVMMGFDALLAGAEAALKPLPNRGTLSDADVKRMATYYHASLLTEDEEHRQGDIEDGAEFGLSDRRFRKLNESISIALAGSEAALAQGNIAVVREEIDELLQTFGIALERSSEAYRKLGNAVLLEQVKALRASLSGGPWGESSEAR